MAEKSVSKTHKLYHEILIFAFIILIILTIYLFYSQVSFEEKVLEKKFYEKDLEEANNVLKVLLNEYKGYNNSYKNINLFYKNEGCLLNILLNKNCNIKSYNKVYSFKTSEGEGFIGYAIFKNQTLLKSFLEQTHNALLLKAQKENYSLILYDASIISKNAINTDNEVLMLLKDIYNQKSTEYYVFFYKNNILWFVKETTNKTTFIRRNLGDSTDFENTQKYIIYYNLTLP